MATGGYDDAWETPGWTAQNMAYPPSDEEVVVPPAGLTNVELVGSFFDQSGKPLYGQFTFTPSTRVVQVGGAQVILRPFGLSLRNGSLHNAFLVQPSVGSDAAPPAWSWHIRQRVGPVVREYDLNVPVTGTQVDVLTLSAQDGATVVEEFPLIRTYTVYVGSTFRREYAWTKPSGSPDLSTWTAKLQVRDLAGTVVLTLTETAGITLGSDGVITVVVSDVQTLALTQPRYSFAMELYEPLGDTIRFVQGTLVTDQNDVT